MSNLLKTVSLSVILILITGCGGSYVVRPGSIEANLVPDNLGEQTLTIINAQKSTEVIRIGGAGAGRALNGSLQEWTDSLIKTLETAFREKGVDVADGSPKVLKIAIKRAVLTTVGGAGFRCSVSLDVETGDNNTMELTAEKAWWKYKGSCDRAVKEAASAILNHDAINNYLKQ